MKMNRRKFMGALAGITGVVAVAKLPKFTESVKYGDGGVVADHATSRRAGMSHTADAHKYYSGAQWDRVEIRAAQEALNRHFRKIVDEAAFNMMTGGKS